MLKIRVATEVDEPFVKQVYKDNKSILGNYYFDWTAFINGDRRKNVFYIADGIGLLNVKYSKKSGCNVIQTIAVVNEKKRMGYGKELVMSVQRPVTLKTDSDNDESNSFYKAIGFVKVGESLSKNKKKKFNIYTLY